MTRGPTGRQDQEQEEREAFQELDSAEQEALCFLLDCAATPLNCQPIRLTTWRAKKGLSNVLAAHERMGVVPTLKEKASKPDNWTDCGLNADVFLGEAVSIATYCIANGHLTTFAAADFLFVRLFGGAARPLVPSIFSAALLHPSVAIDAATAAVELQNALWAGQAGPGRAEPVWFPNHPLPPCEPIPIAP